MCVSILPFFRKPTQDHATIKETRDLLLNEVWSKLFDRLLEKSHLGWYLFFEYNPAIDGDASQIVNAHHTWMDWKYVGRSTRLSQNNIQDYKPKPVWARITIKRITSKIIGNKPKPVWANPDIWQMLDPNFQPSLYETYFMEWWQIHKLVWGNLHLAEAMASTGMA